MVEHLFFWSCSSCGCLRLTIVVAYIPLSVDYIPLVVVDQPVPTCWVGMGWGTKDIVNDHQNCVDETSEWRSCLSFGGSRVNELPAVSPWSVAHFWWFSLCMEKMVTCVLLLADLLIFRSLLTITTKQEGINVSYPTCSPLFAACWSQHLHTWLISTPLFAGEQVHQYHHWIPTNPCSIYLRCWSHHGAAPRTQGRTSRKASFGQLGWWEATPGVDGDGEVPWWVGGWWPWWVNGESTGVDWSIVVI